MRGENEIRTLDVPRLELVEIDVGNDIQIDGVEGELLAEVVVEELLFGGMEAEAGRDLGVAIHGDTHLGV